MIAQDPTPTIASERRTLEVNGVAIGIAAATLAGLIEELGYGDRLVATALNGTFVRRDDRAATTLADNDRVEVLVPMQGG